ncbi:DUF2860 family protein [Desulfobacterales bacterium HSG17]|nr:DUF2860 family protein [Desulfobacterales bacterium HSG17]
MSKIYNIAQHLTQRKLLITIHVKRELKKMKQQILQLVVCSILLIFTTSVQANEPPASGFSGMIQAGGVIIQTNSQLEPDDDNRTIHSLNENEDSFEKYYPFVIFDFRLKLDSGTEFYCNTPFEDEDTGIAAGIAQASEFGKLDIYGYYGLESEVWQDPYITNVPRSETDISTYGGGFKLDRIMESEFSFEYKFRIKDVDKDVIGNRFLDLKRDGSFHKFGLKYGFRLGNSMIIPNIAYILGNFDGDANSYDNISSGLSYMKMTRNYMIKIGIDCGFTTYGKKHPIFSKDREDVAYGVMGMFSWLNPFHLNNFSINFMGGAKTTESNIDFYDTDNIFTGITIGYTFGR